VVADLLSMNSALGPAVFCCQRLHRSIRSTEDPKIFLVVRRGWQVRINRRSVTEEVREREAHGDISSEETTTVNESTPLWDLNACAIHRHCVLAASIPRCRNVLSGCRRWHWFSYPWAFHTAIHLTYWILLLRIVFCNSETTSFKNIGFQYLSSSFIFHLLQTFFCFFWWIQFFPFFCRHHTSWIHHHRRL